MFENIGSFFRRMVKPEQKELGSKDAAKERLHLVLMQDRANVSSEFLELMKQEILDVIKKYIIVDESQIDVRLTNQQNEDGTNGAPSLYANIPIVNIKNEMLVGKVKEFDGKTNSINFGEYKMVIETVSDADAENVQAEESDNEKVVEDFANNENAEAKESKLEDIKEDIEEAKNEIIENVKEKIEEAKEIIAEVKEKVEDKVDDIKEKIKEKEDKIQQDVEQPIIILSDGIQENTTEDVEENKNTETIEIKNEIDAETEVEEVVDISDDDDDYDDDDDVTFDDLLKKAEEEDKRLAEKNRSKEIISEVINRIDEVKEEVSENIIEVKKEAKKVVQNVKNNVQNHPSNKQKKKSKR